MSRVGEPPEVEREPASPITYGRRDQRADRRTGRRDGRKRIPSLAEITALVHSNAPSQLPTPYLEMLFSRARDMMEHERLWYLTATAAIKAEQAELESRVGGARAALEPARAALSEARIELTDADLTARHPAEELRNEAFLRARRQTERGQRIAVAEAAYQRRIAELHGLEDRFAGVAETIQNRLSIARMRALRISAYISARTATYWEGLVLAHRDGKHLAPLLPHLSPRLPDWVVPADPELADEPPSEPEPPVAEPEPAVAESPAPEPPIAGPSTADTPDGGSDDASPQEQPLPAYRW